MKGKHLKTVGWKEAGSYLPLLEAARVAGVNPEALRGWLKRRGRYRYPHTVFWRGRAMVHRDILEDYIHRGNLPRLERLYPGWKPLLELVREYPISYSRAHRASLHGAFRAGRWKRAIYVEPHSFRRWAEATLAPIRHPWIRAADLARRLGVDPAWVRAKAYRRGITVAHRYDPKSRARVAVIHLIEWEDAFGPVDRVKLPALPEGHVLVADVAEREGVTRQAVLAWARGHGFAIRYVSAPDVPRMAAIPEVAARLYARMRARRRRHREEGRRAA